MFAIAKKTVTKWIEVNAPRLSAALAYYTVFSLAPLLVVVVAIAGLAFGRQAAEGQVAAQMRGLIGGQGAEAIQTMLANAHQSGGGPLALGLGLLVLLFGASGVFVELRSSLNTIWGVEEAEPSGLAGWIKKRFSAFALVLAIGFLMLVSLLINAALAVAIRYFTSVLPLPAPVMNMVGIAFSFAVSVAVFALLYKAVPDADIRWRDVWTGATVTAVLFTVGRILIGMYLGQAAVGSAYGAAGSVVVLLAWLYYSALIFFLGATFMRVWAEHKGSLRPDTAGTPERRPRAA